MSKGFIKISGNKEKLNSARLTIFEELNKVGALDLSSQEADLGQVHMFPAFNPTNINSTRLSLINDLSSSFPTFNRMVASAFDEIISELIGPDVLIQKSINLVIQCPGDSQTSEPHRDFPANSAFELVLWVPFVDCPIGRSLYVCSAKKSFEIAGKLNSGKFNDLDRFRDDVLQSSEEVPVMYGEALLFMAPLFHGSEINRTDSTRITCNLRLKSLFTPHGMKSPYSFWDTYSTSPFTDMAIDFTISEFK